jgi:hypothetical protein
MRKTHYMELGCSYGLLRHHGTEMLNANVISEQQREVQWIVRRVRIVNSL